MSARARDTRQIRTNVAAGKRHLRAVLVDEVSAGVDHLTLTPPSPALTIRSMPDAPAPDAAEVDATLRKLEALLADPNIAVRTLYTEDAILMNGGPPLRGRAEILAREDVPALHDVVISPESIDVQGGLASVFGHFSCAFTDPDAGRVDVRCHFMLVLRKETDGVWRVARECLVNDVPADELPSDGAGG